jgi:hypothetical protein
MSMDSIKTEAGHRFHPTGDVAKKHALFAVTPDIPIIDALTSVSCLLSTLEDGIMDAAMGSQPLQDNAAWLTHHTLQSAKAVVDSLIGCMEAQDLRHHVDDWVWKRQGGFVHYYILDDAHIQRAPFGKYGPFPTANEMRKALDRLESKYPEVVLVSRRACLAADLIGESELNDEHAKTMEKLVDLGV